MIQKKGLPKYTRQRPDHTAALNRARSKYRAAIEMIDQILEKTEEEFAVAFARQDAVESNRDRIARAAAQQRSKGRRA